MPILVPQSLVPTASTPTTSLQSSAFASAVATGDTILVFVWLSTPGVTVTGVTDAAGNSYVRDLFSVNVANRCEVWRASNVVGGGSFKITVNTSVSAYITVAACEVSGLSNVSPIDGSGATNVGSQSDATATTGAFTTTNPTDLIIATFASGQMSAVTLPAGFSAIASKLSGGTFEDGAAAYQIVSNVQSGISPTWTGVSGTSSVYAACGLAYKAGGVGPFPWFFDQSMRGGCDNTGF